MIFERIIFSLKRNNIDKDVSASIYRKIIQNVVELSIEECNILAIDKNQKEPKKQRAKGRKIPTVRVVNL